VLGLLNAVLVLGSSGIGVTVGVFGLEAGPVAVGVGLGEEVAGLLTAVAGADGVDVTALPLPATLLAWAMVLPRLES